jgi:2-polyprenyl-6-methoxyphenol hydroxylase-like FAD-dependent oxidoreductase
MRRIGDHAVVLGASLAGLLAARVLADAYGRVTVVERDPLPQTAENRKGVPQGRHAHLLLPRGAQILDGLFPGLLDDLVAGGAPVIRDLGELRFSPGGHRLRLEGHPPEAITYQASRPYLDRTRRPRGGLAGDDRLRPPPGRATPGPGEVRHPTPAPAPGGTGR